MAQQLYKVILNSTLSFAFNDIINTLVLTLNSSTNQYSSTENIYHSPINKSVMALKFKSIYGSSD